MVFLSKLRGRVRATAHRAVEHPHRCGGAGITAAPRRVPPHPALPIQEGPTGPIGNGRPPDVRGVGLALQPELVEHGPSVDRRANQQERAADLVEAVSRQVSKPDAEDDRAYARRALGQPQLLRLSDDYSRVP